MLKTKPIDMKLMPNILLLNKNHFRCSLKSLVFRFFKDLKNKQVNKKLATAYVAVC